MTGKSFCSVLFCFLVGALPHFVGSSFPGGDANDWPDRFGSWPHCSRVPIGKGKQEGPYRGRGLRGTNYHV